jgi:osmotically-inducible protein OsmY
VHNEWPSDEEVIEKVRRALFKDRLIDQLDIEIKVENGDVSLMGMVSSQKLKTFAQKATEDVLGVKRVHNQLTLKPDYGLIGGHLEWPQ